MNEIIKLPIPDRLEPKATPRSLMTSVRMYFYSLYNATDATFRNLLASVGNKDSLTGNRLFDRHDAVGMIKANAKKANDTMTENAKDGLIYKHVVKLLHDEGMGLKLRRQQYKQLTHQQPAE